MNNPNFFEKFTSRLKNSLVAAYEIAVETGSPKVRTDHLLYGMIMEKGSIASEILRKGGVNLEVLRGGLYAGRHEDRVGNLGKAFEIIQKFKQTKDFKIIIFSDSAKKAIARAVLEANRKGHGFVGTEHLLYGVLSADSSRALDFLRKMKANTPLIKRQVEMVLKSTARFADLTNMFDTAESGEMGMMEGPIPGRVADNRSPIEAFCRDLTNHNFQQDVDPVIGRDGEIRRIINVLGRRTKNNPILLGDPGVGKTAIVEGLAKKILTGDVPDSLAGKRIISLDLAQIVAGTIFRGEFESRIKGVINEIEKDPAIILFIDEIHSIMGLGNASGSMDAASILKPALSKSKLQVIGATTPDEYRKHIEKDPALERRFQVVNVSEPSVEEAKQIIRGVRGNYEEYHRVNIEDSAVEAAVVLSKRYLPDRFLPDKAIDLIDEAASELKIREKDSAYFKQLKKLESEMNDIIIKKEHAVRSEHYDEALALRKTELEIGEKIRRHRKNYDKKDKKDWPKITDQEIAEIVSKITGVPVENLVKKDQEKLLTLEDKLRKRIIGQDEAVQAISRFIRRSRSGVASPNRPIGSFMFLGPTGVGKTELAKVIAEVAFEDEKALIRVDMSEFSEKFNVSKLIGAPAGYVGFEEGGKLTENVRKKPYSVVLFDEIEKAHPEVFNLLLQMLEDGMLTDAAGRKVNFKNTIIIMTSNTGTEALSASGRIGFGSEELNLEKEAEQDSERYEEFKKNISEELKRNFRPEFLNRVDKIIIFKPLSRQAILKIVDLQIAELRDRIKEKGIDLSLTKDARSELARRGFDIEKGARPLRRVIQEEIEDQLAESLISKNFKKGDRLGIDYSKKDHDFKVEKK